MSYHLEGKVFTSIANSDNGEVDSQTVFTYHQKGTKVWAEYKGGSIIEGHLIANVQSDGKLDMRYHHINEQDELMMGTCISTPEFLEDGRLKFYEKWQWLSGDKSSGQSEIIELDR